MNLNHIVICGRTTAKPEVKTTSGGMNVTHFTVAVSRAWKDKVGQKQETTEFIRVVFWGKTADLIVKYVEKGQIVIVEGRLTTRSWEDNGQKKYMTEITGENIQFGPKVEAKTVPPEEEVGNKTMETEAVPTVDITSEDMPF